MLKDPGLWDEYDGLLEEHLACVRRDDMLGADEYLKLMEEKRRDIEGSVPPHAAGEEDKPIADRLYEAIERVLTDHRLQHWYTADDAGENFRLLDHLSSGDTIESGRDEIRLICDSIYNGVLLKEFPAASQAVPETMPDWVRWQVRDALKADPAWEPYRAIRWFADRVTELERELEEQGHRAERWREVAIGTPPVIFEDDLRALLQEFRSLQASTAQETKRLMFVSALSGSQLLTLQVRAFRQGVLTPESFREELDAEMARPVEGGVPKQTIMGIPVQVSEGAPAGEIRLVAPRPVEGA